MSSPRNPILDLVAAAAADSGFRDPEQAARALCDAVLAINDMHGRRDDVVVLGGALALLAEAAARRGFDVRTLLARAAAWAVADPRSLEEDQPTPGPSALNDRLSTAMMQAMQALLRLCHREMDRAAVNEELYRTVLSAELFEQVSAGPRDPDACLTAAIPRDLVLDRMYGLTWQRQHAEDVFRRNLAPERRRDVRKQLDEAAGALHRLGCTVDVDRAMGVGIALWRPRSLAGDAGVHGLCFTFGRGLGEPGAADFVLRFDARDDSAGEFAAQLVYRAHLIERRRPGRECIDIDGLQLRMQPRERRQWDALLRESGIDGSLVRRCTRRIATLEFCAEATERAFRSRLVPVEEPQPATQLPASSTRH